MRSYQGRRENARSRAWDPLSFAVRPAAPTITSNGFRRRLSYALVADGGPPREAHRGGLGLTWVSGGGVDMLHVSVLGAQTITDDWTGNVRTRSSRTVALLGFLVAHAGSPQMRQRIAGLFWPDSTDAQALTNLRRELHN